MNNVKYIKINKINSQKLKIIKLKYLIKIYKY